MDDEPSLHDAYRLLIQTKYKDAELHFYREGNSALDELLREAPDLLITDIHHPGIDGLKIVNRLAEEKAKYSVMIISASSGKQQPDEYTGQNLEVTFLEKPVNALRFYSELSRLFGYNNGLSS